MVRAQHRHRTDCTVESTYELWTEIQAAGTFITFTDPAAGDLTGFTDIRTLGPDTAGRARISIIVPSLATSDIAGDVMTLSQAVALQSGLPARARDAYSYILSSCDDPQERVATVQNASRLLPRPIVEELLAMERTGPDGKGEFESVRDDLERDDVARGGEDAGVQAPGEQVRRVERLAREEGNAADARLLGWYRLLRDDHEAAEEWFRRAMETDPSADAAQGLGLAMIGQSEYAEAEDVTYPWRDASDDNRKAYLAAAANILGIEPRVALPAEVLERIVGEAAAAKDVPRRGSSAGTRVAMASIKRLANGSRRRSIGIPMTSRSPMVWR